MREFKFRAWNGEVMISDNNHYLPFICPTNDYVLMFETYSMGGSDFNGLRGLNVMQFTGFNDKYGKDIYEGDILDCQDRIVQVVWHEEKGQWDSNFIRYQFDLCSNGIDNVDFKYRAVVIGNIYENPELL